MNEAPVVPMRDSHGESPATTSAHLIRLMALPSRGVTAATRVLDHRLARVTGVDHTLTATADVIAIVPSRPASW